MTSNQPEQERVVAVLLSQAGIPVPEDQIGKLSQMYRDAEKARETLRSVNLGETEPMVIFASNLEATDE